MVDSDLCQQVKGKLKREGEKNTKVMQLEKKNLLHKQVGCVPTKVFFLKGATIHTLESDKIKFKAL